MTGISFKALREIMIYKALFNILFGYVRILEAIAVCEM
jgi:hypothetical protein